ncbi:MULTISPECIES: porin [Rheinheimera]|uniref:Porin n=1 Tax=Rheinheimera marina TaxID=1774958 RepID=A0ABV9JJD7_9GAMM
MVKLSAKATALSLLVSAITPCNPAAAFDWDYYGKLELQGLYTDQDLFRYVDEGWQIEAPFSRLGLKGSQQLTESVALIAVYEWQVNGLDQANKDHRLGSRNTYLGFSTAWGELVFGKNDTRFKKSEGKLDLFNETLADMAQLTPGQDRMENTISYTSPVLQGWQWSATYQTGASDEQAGGYDWVMSYGDASFKQQPYYLAYGQTSELNGLDAERLLAHAKLADYAGSVFSAGLMWQYSDSGCPAALWPCLADSSSLELSELADQAAMATRQQSHTP